MFYTAKDKLWKDETGAEVPYNRTTGLERLKERHSKKLIGTAERVSAKLAELKNELRQMCDEVYLEAAAELGSSGNGKGNFTWYNFDRSVKVEVSVSERVEFDDLTIQAAKERLDAFLDENIAAKTDFAKELVVDAFTTTRGKLDAKKVLGLLRYRERIQHAGFQEAMSLIERSIRRPDSKTYYRLWLKDDTGEYKALKLNITEL